MERSILGWIFFGLVIGILAKLIVPGRDPGGFIVSALLGIAGALLAGFLGRSAGFYGPDQPAGWIAATLGAVAILIVYRLAIRRAGG